MKIVLFIALALLSVPTFAKDSGNHKIRANVERKIASSCDLFKAARDYTVDMAKKNFNVEAKDVVSDPGANPMREGTLLIMFSIPSIKLVGYVEFDDNACKGLDFRWTNQLLK